MLGVPDAVTANDYSPLDALRLAVRLESIRRPQVALLIEVRVRILREFIPGVRKYAAGITSQLSGLNSLRWLTGFLQRFGDRPHLGLHCIGHDGTSCFRGCIGSRFHTGSGFCACCRRFLRSSGTQELSADC